MKQAKSAARGKPGRKASGLRDLPPAAARLAINEAALKAVRQALALQDDFRKRSGMSGGLPTLERMIRADVVLDQVKVPEAGEVHLRPVLRASTLTEQLLKAGFDRRSAWTGERFARDVEASTIGKLTGSYGEGRGGGTASEPERVLIAVDRVRRATEPLNRQERTAVWSVLVFGLSMTDTGWALAGERMGSARPRLNDAAWLFLAAALERMAPYYEALGDETV
jgi:hypothetical protein